MPDAPAIVSWKDKLSEAFTATEAARAQRMAASEKPDAPALTTPPETVDAEHEPSVTTETQPEQVPPTPAVQPVGEDDFLSEKEGDSADLRDFKANLKSGWQKKMTELDLKLKELGAGSGSLADAQKKAQVLDALLASEDPAAAITAAREGLGIVPQGQEPQRVFQPRVLKEQFAKTGLHVDVVEPLEDAFDIYMEAKFLPILMPFAAYIQQQMVKGAGSEWEGLAAKYGAPADQVKKQAYELAAKAQIPLETALVAALHQSGAEAAPKPKTPPAPPRKETPQLARVNGLPPNSKGPTTYAEEKNKLLQLLQSRQPQHVGGWTAPHRRIQGK